MPAERLSMRQIRDVLRLCFESRLALKPTMRQVHLAGEKLFVDFAGRTGEVIDANTGEIIPVRIFVAVLGASSFTYAEAT